MFSLNSRIVGHILPSNSCFVGTYVTIITFFINFSKAFYNSRAYFFFMQKEEYVSILLRLGVGFVFVWFGVDKFFHPAVWLGWVPMPASNNLIYFLGAVETLVGLFILFGFLLKFAAIVASLMLFGIIVSIPFSEISVRDISIFFAALALLFSRDSFSIDVWWRR